MPKALLSSKVGKREQQDATQINAIIGQLNKVTSDITDANIQFFTPPSVPGYGSADGFEMQLIDKSAGSFTNLDDAAQNLLEVCLEKTPSPLPIVLLVQNFLSII